MEITELTNGKKDLEISLKTRHVADACLEQAEFGRILHVPTMTNTSICFSGGVARYLTPILDLDNPEESKLTRFLFFIP